MLWVGWFGLHGGIALGASDDAASAIINTHVSACASALIWAGLDRFRTGKVNPVGMASGAVAGLVAISAGAAFIAPAWAIVTGLAGGAAAYFAVQLMHKRFASSYGVTMFAVHAIAGMVGCVLLGLFVSETFNGGGLPPGTGILAQTGVQAMGVLLVATWSIIGTLIVGYALSMVVPMHVHDQDDAG